MSDYFDVILVGVGPSNLGMLCALTDLRPSTTCVALEAQTRFEWHPDSSLPGTTLQVSLLHDLVSLRNPTSRYSFLNYLKEKERLATFARLGRWFPTRVEFTDYYRWVAAQHANYIRYGVRATGVSFAAGGSSRDRLVRVEAQRGGERLALYARALIVGTGSSAPSVDDDDRLCHSSAFLSRYEKFRATAGPHTVVIVGGGQSAVDIALYLLTTFQDVNVRLVCHAPTLVAPNVSPFANEVFYDDTVLARRHESPAYFSFLRQWTDALNFGAADPETLHALFATAYDDAVLGRRRLMIFGAGHFEGTTSGAGPRKTVHVVSRIDGTRTTYDADFVVLATGYSGSARLPLLKNVASFYARSGTSDFEVMPDYRLRPAVDSAPHIWINGGVDVEHGVVTRTLHHIPYRTEKIARQLGEILDAGNR